MNKLRIFVLSMAMLIVAGCSNISSGGYYWGDYSSSYYDLLKDPSEEQLAKRVESLQGIIAKSDELGLRVAPGIHAELAQALMKQGLESQAMDHFRIEIELYPESEAFIRRLVEL